MALLYGKPIADRILSDTKQRITLSQIVPGLAVILVGDDASSHLYVRLKEEASQSVGIHFEKFLFPSSTDTSLLFRCIDTLNDRPDIHGIIVQLPLPPLFDTDLIIARIDPKKDADGFHNETIQQFLAEKKEYCPVFPRAMIELLRTAGGYYVGDSGLVIANSDLLGQVMVQALTLEGLRATYVLSSASREQLAEKTREASVIITACGRSNLLTGEMIRDNAVVIDGGISQYNGKVVGDVERETVENKARFLTPVPGGVGPVTVATLLARVTDIAMRTVDK